MTDRPRSYQTRGDKPPGRTQRWLKVLGIVLAVAALIVVAMAVVFGGGHGGGPADHF